MRVIGITGGIATGKSTVTQMLAGLGAPTLSADSVARDVLAPGTETTRQVLAVFPACADPGSTGTIDRRALSLLVFADPDARRRLQSLTHPAIRALMFPQIAAWQAAGEGTAAVEIPLLYEGGWETALNGVVVVTCAEATQLARLRARLGIDEAEARRQIAAQWPLSEKAARADFIITTDGTPEDTRLQAQALWNTL